MLKKLAKYGNSTTLVIDKAILELLNMNESSVVKLHTDGKSLIITPVQSEQMQDKKVSYENYEEAMVQSLNKCKQVAVQNTPPAQLLSPEDTLLMQKEVADLFAKSDAMRDFALQSPNNQAFVSKIAVLSEQYDPVADYEQYMKAYLAIRNEFYPELAQLDLEMADILKKYQQSKS